MPRYETESLLNEVGVTPELSACGCVGSSDSLIVDLLVAVVKDVILLFAPI